MATILTSRERRDFTMVQRATICSALFLLTLAQASSASDDAPKVAPPDSLNFVRGDDVWVPGWVFNNSDDWLALSCTEQVCQIVPAGLRVTPASWQGHHDDLATSGQKLGFSKSIEAPGEVVAWISQNENLPWLSPGAVELYHAHQLTPVVQDKKDTYEIVIETAEGAREDLAPVLRLKAGSHEGRSQMYPGDAIYLRLRARGSQQLLSEQVAVCSGELSLNYLLWSGDLDRDGETDYLIDYIDSVRFYLSSYAQEDQLVGEAGVGIIHPLDGDCA